MSYSIILLKKGKIQSLERRHPWIFSGAINSDVSQLRTGEKVSIADRNGKIVATGHFSEGSIAVRILSFAETIIDEAFYAGRLQRALKVRNESQLPNAHTNAYRLIHGEGDELPGLIIDIYNDVAVVQVHSMGMAHDAELIEHALSQVMGKSLKRILLASAGKEVTLSKLSSAGESVVDICEHGHSFRVNYETGQKTGFFLDQRENRELLAKYSKDKKVLNAFCYSGGFSIYALNAGALEVHSLDSSSKALDLLRLNLELNHLQNTRHTVLKMDALDYLNSDEAALAGYDCIILDPPAFAKHRSARHSAVQAYKRLNKRALSILNPGGILFTFSCSQVVSSKLFNDTIAAAAMETKRHVRILQHLQQPADHPVSIFHPEGEYLKGLILAVK